MAIIQQIPAQNIRSKPSIIHRNFSKIVSSTFTSYLLYLSPRKICISQSSGLVGESKQTHSASSYSYSV
jgi:hypothetical protein